VRLYNERLASEEELMREAKEVIRQYSIEEGRRITEEKRLATEPDEQGWVTVPSR
jgi:hypothetical protein